MLQGAPARSSGAAADADSTSTVREHDMAISWWWFFAKKLTRVNAFLWFGTLNDDFTQVEYAAGDDEEEEEEDEDCDDEEDEDDGDYDYEDDDAEPEDEENWDRGWSTGLSGDARNGGQKSSSEAVDTSASSDATPASDRVCSQIMFI